jgi:RDD family
MRSTLYEALEIDSTSEVPAIRAALRTVLRRFWSAPRDASGDNEEAVRFVALAASILTDDARRESYDASARPAGGNNPWRADIPPNPGSGITSSLGGEIHEAGASEIGVSIGEPKLLPAISALANPLPEEKNWAPAYLYAAAAAAALVLFAGVWMLLADALGTFAVFVVWALALTASYAIAMSVRGPAFEQAATSLSRLAIVKWRRESSVFIGNPPPQQDTAWIFRLRVMELTRSAAGYSTLPRAGHRILARAADYALIALAILILFALTNLFAPSAYAVTAVLRSPIVLPIIVVLAGIAYDVFWLSRWRTSPGKWLVGAVVATGVTQPDDHVDETQSQRLWRRARVQAMDAMSLGLWPVAAIRAGARIKMIRNGESAWDAASDSVVAIRATPVIARATAVAIALGAAGALAHLWIIDAKALKQTIDAAFDSAKSTVAGAVPTPPPAPVSTESSAAPAAPATNTTVAVVDAGAATSATNATNVPGATSGATTAAVATAAPAVPAPVAPTVESAPKTLINPKSTPAPETKSVPLAPNTSSVGTSAQLQKQLDAQTRSAQERRARIDKVAAQVLAARQKGNYAALQGACQRWTDDQPGSAEAWRCLGLAKFQSGAGRDALPALRQALKLEPNDSEVESAILRILRP